MSMTTTQSPIVNGVHPPVWDPLFRITVQQYHEMIDKGILGPEDNVELLEGLLVRKMPTNPPHSYVKTLILRWLVRMLPPTWFPHVQDPVTTSDSEPEPDISVLRGDPADYLQRHPLASDTGLLVEVSDSTLARDREKRRIYARAGFPVYWIVNIPDRQIEVYTQPSGPAAVPQYAQMDIYKEGDRVPVVLDGNEVGRISVTEVLPR